MSSLSGFASGTIWLGRSEATKARKPESRVTFYVFRKNAENAPTNDSTGVELDGCQPLYGLAHKRELSLPVYVFASRSASEFVDCGRGYLTYDFLAAV